MIKLITLEKNGEQVAIELRNTRITVFDEMGIQYGYGEPDEYEAEREFNCQIGQLIQEGYKVTDFIKYDDKQVNEEIPF